MKVLVYFQPKVRRDNFEAMRLRKDIKGACELNGVVYTSNLLENYDIAHFISINDEAKINDCIESGVPVIISALMCESDPVGKMLDYDDTGRYELRARAMRIFNKVNMILVPSKEAKEFLINEGVTTPINILNSGVNMARFEAINDNELNVFPRYFGLKENDKFAITIGDYDDKNQIDKIVQIAKKCPRAKFFFIGGSKKSLNALKRKINRLQRVSPKNVKFSMILDDDLFRSSLMNASMFISLNDRKFESISIIEAMAAKDEIFVLSSHEHNPDYLSNLVHFAKNIDEITNSINEFLDGTLKSTIEPAYLYAKSNSLYLNGQQLKKYYLDLYKSKGEKR